MTLTEPKPEFALIAMTFRPISSRHRNGPPAHLTMPVITERRLGPVVRHARPMPCIISLTPFARALGRSVLAVGIAWACGWLAGAVPVEFHVATNGSDAWSGTLSTPNASRTDGPWASLEGARTGIRRLRGASGLPTGGVRVTIHAGVYPLKRPLGLTREDSGTQEAPIAYCAAAGAEVRISGGRAISHFEAVTDATVLTRIFHKAPDFSPPA